MNKKIILLITIILLLNINCFSNIFKFDTIPLLNHKINYRPQFHFTPKNTWTNDPNGLVYYKGLYHLFYQNNPFATVWGHMSWAHATSKDLIKWKDEKMAIPEYKNKDSAVINIFSGTAIEDSFNTAGFGTENNKSPLIAIYTSNVENGLQHQSLAYSLDGIHFENYSNNPILNIQSKEFRDPKVFWHYPTKKWILIVSKPDLHKVQFYSSTNLKNWIFESDFGPVGNIDKVWECPDFFEIKVENENKTKWVITNSAGHPQQGFLAMQYFIGDFDGKKFTLTEDNYPKYVDYGKDFYAGIIYNNLPQKDSRKIMIAWANCWEYANLIPTNGFRGTMSIPRELTLHYQPNYGYILKNYPIKELKKYRKSKIFENDFLYIFNKACDINYYNEKALDIEFEISKITASETGIHIFYSATQGTNIYYNKIENAIYLDRTNSGDTSFSNRFKSKEKIQLNKNYENLKFRILIDNSIVELFINDGEYTITDQIFPLQFKNTIISLYSKEGGAIYKNIYFYPIKKINN